MLRSRGEALGRGSYRALVELRVELRAEACAELRVEACAEPRAGVRTCGCADVQTCRRSYGRLIAETFIETIV